MTLKVFPVLAGVTYPVLKTPIWKTDVHTAVSGKRTAVQWQSYPIYRIELSYTFLRTAAANLEYQTLLAFFNSVGGRASAFRFNDPMDNLIVSNFMGFGDGQTTEFQLLRTITGVGGITWSDPVTYPVVCDLYVNGAHQTLGVDYTLSATGLVTFTVAPAIGDYINWSGLYDFLCRFDEDSATFEQFTYNLFELKKIAFSTEKV